MKYRVYHTTEYSYSAPVFLEPHTVRMHPRAGDGAHISNAMLEVEPAPAGRFRGIDIHGNIVHHLWFEGLTRSFRLHSSFEVETVPFNPLGYLIYPGENVQLPVRYEPEVAPLAAAYLIRCSTNVPITAFATAIAQDVGRETLPFLNTLSQRIHSLCTRVRREAGPPLPPEVTLKNLKGSCRDLAVLFIDACRALGLAARFVSGYLLEPEREFEHEFHAWAEVYVPGAGWRGYDPSLGLATANRHIAVAVGRVSNQAAPLQGSFRGAGVSAAMTASINVVDAAGATRTQLASGALGA